MTTTDTIITPPSDSLRRPTYARLWAGVPRELGFLLPVLPIFIAGTTITATLFFTGIGMIVLIAGIFIALAALYVARGFGIFELMRLRAAGFPAITAPAWDRAAPRARWFGKLFAPVIDGHYWLYLLHTMVVNPIVGVVTWSITIVWTSTALGGLSYWFWQRFIPLGDRGWTFFGVTSEFFTGRVTEMDARTGDSIFFLITGVIFAVTLPFITRGLTWVHHQIARGMLSAWTSESLRQQVSGLASSRSAAVAAEGTALRRLERDIHDGPQQRLVRLQMDLAAADRQLDTDPAAARALLDEAMQQSKDALDELRALSRGFAPPILMDRGLVAALESLAVRAAVPTHVTSELPEGMEVPPEVERNAYFIAAEALTNVAKHSGANTATVLVAVEGVSEDAGGSAGGSGTRSLVLTVSDNGHGGAAEVEGHGIAGLVERVHGLGGILDLTSPDGGPTVVLVRLPL
ncbi:MAG TPA: sensor domain-containing protein [Pseudolysinimonas sp.]|nr:sensor domain-containing protein [Pseudolysinimonas sp.]